MMKRIWIVLILLMLSGCDAPAQTAVIPEVRGTIQQMTAEQEYSGGVYRNSAFGFGCVLNENWICADEAELKARKESARTTEKLPDDADFFVDFYACAEDHSAAIEVVVENMGVLYGAIWSEEQYLNNALEEIDAYLEDSEIAYGTAEAVEITFGGKTYPSILVTGSVGDVPVYQRQVYLKSGDYMAVVSVSCFQVDISEAVFGLFFLTN